MKDNNCINKNISLEFGELSKFFKVIGEANRLRILCLLKNGERCVCDIYENLELSQNLVSSHLKVLKDLDLIGLRQEKQKNYYFINKKIFKKYNLSLNKFFKSYEQ
jgi:ArsR family transcriptional regulator